MTMVGMIGGMPAGTKKAVAVAVSTLFLSLAAAPLSAQGPSPTTILDPILDYGSDPDGDGQYDYLVLKVPVMVELADLYGVGAQLYVQGSGSPFARASQKPFLDAGEQSITLTFVGSDLLSIQGAQTLEFRIIIADSSGRAVDGRVHLSSGTYSGSMFEGTTGPAAPEFTGRVREVPEEVIPGGGFGYLNLTFEVRNLTTARAEVAGTLNEVVKGTGVLRSFFAENLTALVELRFDGGAIRDNGVLGPYSVSVRLTPDGGKEVAYDYRTAAYNFTDFVRPGAPVAFTGNGTDAGSDQDGDGLFEQLSVLVEANISLEGAYIFKASLKLPQQYRAVQQLVPRPMASFYFSEKGIRSVAFNFSGPVIRMLQLDGPYRIMVDAFSERVLFVANGTYDTNAYLSTQFEPSRLPARFSGNATVGARDNDGNGLYDILTVSVPVEVAAAGSYQLAGAMYAGGRFITWSGGRLKLGAGQGSVSLSFNGEAVRKAGFDGPYTVVLYLAGVTGERSGIEAYLPPDRLELRTGAYKAIEFDRVAGRKQPLPPPEDPEVKVGEGSYLGRAQGITVEVNRSAPDITFYYTLDDGRSARFRLVFTQLAAYADSNSNGVYDSGEERFLGPLSLADWESSKVELTGGLGDRTVRYNLTAVLDLTTVERNAGSGQPEARMPQWGRMTFSFTMTSRNVDYTEPVAFSLRGGTEMKIDILIEPWRALPQSISGLALQHFLSDESGRNYFKTFESDQTRVFKPGLADVTGAIFKPAITALQKIGLAGTMGKEHGYYTWLHTVQVTSGDGSKAYLPVNLTYSTDGQQMALVLNYPLPEGAVALFHDPTVGVNATNAPEPWTIKVGRIFNPVIYIVAVAVAAAVVIVIRRSQRNGE